MVLEPTPTSPAATKGQRPNAGVAEQLRAARQARRWAVLWSLLANVMVAIVMLQFAGVTSRMIHLGSPLSNAQIHYFQDVSGQHGIASTSWLPFMPIEEHQRYIGYSKKVHWLKLRIDKVALAAKQPVYLNLSLADIGRAELYVPEQGADGVVFSRQVIGLEVDKAQRTPYLHHPVFRIDTAVLAGEWVYLRLQSLNPLLIKPRLLTQEEYASEWARLLALGAVILCVFSIMLFSGVMWWRASQKGHLLMLVVGALPLLVIELGSKNLLYDLPVMANPWLAPRMVPAALVLFLFAYMQISRYRFALEDSGLSKGFVRFFRVLSFLPLAYAVLIFTPFAQQVLFLISVHYIFATTFLWVIWLAVIDTSGGKRIFISSLQLMFAVMTSLSALDNFGVQSPFSELSPLIGSTVFTFGCISYGLALQYLMPMRYIQKQRVEHDYRRNVLQAVETQVLQRTMELEQAKNAAELQAAEVARHSTELSHELRSPLSAILGVSKLLIGNGAVSGYVKKDVGTIARLAVGLLKYVDAKLAEIASGLTVRNEAARSEVSVVSTADMIHDFQNVSEWMSIHHNNYFSLESTNRIPSLVELQENGFRQVFINLVTNAGRYCEEGMVSLKIDYSDAQNLMPPHLVLEVIDTGAGMDTEMLERLFDRHAKSRSSVGLGIGLALVKELVESAGGSIEVASTRKKGTRFVVRYPAKRVTEKNLTVMDLTAPLETVNAANAESMGFAASELPPPPQRSARVDAELSDMKAAHWMAANGQFSDLEHWLGAARSRDGISPETAQFLAVLDERLHRLDFAGMEELLRAPKSS